MAQRLASLSLVLCRTNPAQLCAVVEACAALTELHDVVSADGAVVYLDVCKSPASHSTAVLYHHLCRAALEASSAHYTPPRVSNEPHAHSATAFHFFTSKRFTGAEPLPAPAPAPSDFDSEAIFFFFVSKFQF